MLKAEKGSTSKDQREMFPVTDLSQRYHTDVEYT